ncbi:hypothetical protein [Thermosulfuriphilus sp.]
MAEIDRIYRFYEPRGLRAGFVFLEPDPSEDLLLWLKGLLIPSAVPLKETFKEIVSGYHLESAENLLVLSRLNQVVEVFYDLKAENLESFKRALSAFWANPPLMG